MILFDIFMGVMIAAAAALLIILVMVIYKDLVKNG